jgi:hypothetical protein
VYLTAALLRDKLKSEIIENVTVPCRNPTPTSPQCRTTRLLKYETFSAIAFCVVQILPALIQTAQKIHTRDRYRFVRHAKSEYFVASKHFFFVLLSCPRQSGIKLIGCNISRDFLSEKNRLFDDISGGGFKNRRPIVCRGAKNGVTP